MQETSHASPKQILMQIGNLLSLTPINTVIPAKAGTSKITFSVCRKLPMHLQSKFSCKLGTSPISHEAFFTFFGGESLQNNFFRMQETSHASPKQILMQIGNLPNIPRTFLIFLDARTSKITFFGGWNLLFLPQ
jgi:hypothetical protein